MQLKKNFPYLVAGYVITVGLFLGISFLIEGILLDFKPPGNRLVFVFSIIFITADTYAIHLLKRGKLEKSDKTIVGIRKEAVEKLDEPALLAQIALEDRNPKVRKTAENAWKKLITEAIDCGFCTVAVLLR
jgi:hypothetical protein